MDPFKEKTIILWDTEYTCWEGCNENGWDKDKNQFREFIQIALLKIDVETMDIIEELLVFVKPIKNPKLSDYCKELTTIKQESIDQADIFDKVLMKMKEFISNLNCYSFGHDYEVLYENLAIHSLDNPFRKDQFYNLKPFFIEKGVDIKGYSSGTISEYFGVPSPHHTHDAMGDAKTLLIGLKELKKRLDEKEKN